jgi:Ca2+-binding EF-hand superfamily protein
MQISSTPTAYGGGEAQRLLNMLMQQQAAPAGQDLPGDATPTTTPTTTATPPPPTSSPNAAQFASDTLASLLSAQQAPSASSVAQQVISAADTSGDGTLSLGEVETAIGGDTASGTNAASQAFAQIDTNGDGQISQSELTNALSAQDAAQNGTQGPQGAHHHHHHHGGGGGGGGGASGQASTDLATQLLGATDTNGDGQLSLSELESTFGLAPASAGASSTAGASNATSTPDASTLASDAVSALTSAFNKLDSNSDGALSVSELTAGIDAFQAALNHNGASTAQNHSAQAVTA